MDDEGGVVLAVGADEDSGAAAAQAVRVEPGLFERLPGGLQEQPLLRVHGERLARADPEELRVEGAGVLEEAAVAGVGGAGAVRVGVVERVDVPAAVGGEGSDRVAALGEQLPQVLRRGDAAGEAAGHADDGDRLVGGGGGDHVLVPGGLLTEQAGPQEAGEGRRARVVEDDGGGQGEPGGGGEGGPQLHGGQRVEADLAERLVGGDRVSRHPAEDGGGVGAYEVDEGAARLGLGQ